jgi:8-oxo-dGTP pyrophosphatase MutT (NUDIX family)/phosphohistidine phosphatase SixA
VSDEPPRASGEVVRAAGGLVGRLGSGGAEVILVHRPKYDDWTLPKGKLGAGESDEEGARREVLEETGLACSLGGELPSTSYVDPQGRPKTVRYWLMRATEAGAEFEPNHEVDRIVWARPDQALERLTFERDREVLRAALDLDAPCFLVRHAKAGDRADWTAEDRLRPLSKKGRRQAEALVDAFRGVPLVRILTSPYVRCEQSVKPLALDRGIRLERHAALAETAPLEDGLALVEELAPTPAVCCSHGDVIPNIVQALEGAGVPLEGERTFKKGSTWLLEREAGIVVRARSLGMV